MGVSFLHWMISWTFCAPSSVANYLVPGSLSRHAFACVSLGVTIPSPSPPALSPWTDCNEILWTDSDRATEWNEQGAWWWSRSGISTFQVIIILVLRARRGGSQSQRNSTPGLRITEVFFCSPQGSFLSLGFIEAFGLHCLTGQHLSRSAVPENS